MKYISTLPPGQPYKKKLIKGQIYKLILDQKQIQDLELESWLFDILKIKSIEAYQYQTMAYEYLLL